jgi:hypothetical protein
VDDSVTLDRREIYDALAEMPVKALSSTYYPAEDRVRDAFSESGSPVITFHSVLKYGAFPLAEILTEILHIGEQGIGSPVEIEFCVNLGSGPNAAGEFALLQVRPMGAREEMMHVDISKEDIDRSFIHSQQALGNTITRNIQDIVFVKPEDFDPAKTLAIAQEIGKMNALFTRQNRKYLLIGPGRWGSADRWLGIPVRWEDISGVGAMVETEHQKLQAEPSQGSHFFHNITTLGINYLTVSERKGDGIHWQWLNDLPKEMETEHMAHVHLRQPFTLKVDGRHSLAVICIEDKTQLAARGKRLKPGIGYEKRSRPQLFCSEPSHAVHRGYGDF